MHQGQMHRVFAGALQEILGAIEGIEDPQPLRRQWLPRLQLLAGGLLAQQRPGRLGKASLRPSSSQRFTARSAADTGPSPPCSTCRAAGKP